MRTMASSKSHSQKNDTTYHVRMGPLSPTAVYEATIPAENNKPALFLESNCPISVFTNNNGHDKCRNYIHQDHHNYHNSSMPASSGPETVNASNCCCATKNCGPMPKHNGGSVFNLASGCHSANNACCAPPANCMPAGKCHCPTTCCPPKVQHSHGNIHFFHPMPPSNAPLGHATVIPKTIFECRECGRTVPASFGSHCYMTVCRSKSDCNMVLHSETDWLMHMAAAHKEEFAKYQWCTLCQRPYPPEHFQVRSRACADCRGPFY